MAEDVHVPGGFFSINSEWMTKAIKYDDATLVKATGKNWKQWMAVFKKINAKDLPHKEIASLLERDYEVSGWWAQSLTVRFEQETGKRIPGERSDGSFNVTVSGSLSGDVDTVFEKWTNKYASVSSFNKMKISGEPSTSVTPKWRYWKIRLADKSRLNINFAQKSEDKTLVQINHENLADTDELEKWRVYWKKELSSL
jgi:hypothetical protein